MCVGGSRVESVGPGAWIANIGTPSAIRVQRLNPPGAPESRSVFLKLCFLFFFETYIIFLMSPQ